MSDSKLFIKYHAKIALNELGESDIGGLKSHINGRIQNSSMSAGEVRQLHTMVKDIHPIIMPAQTKKGLKWLKGCRYKFNDFQKEIIENFKQFRLVDFIDCYYKEDNFKLADHRPVYRVESYKNHFFDYYAYPWQTGVYMEKGRIILRIL